MKRPEAVRQILVLRVSDMLRLLRTQMSYQPELETDVLCHLDTQQPFEQLTIETVNWLLAKFGHQTKQAGTRFDPTKRAVAKKHGKTRGRGALTAEDRALLGKRRAV